MQTVSINHEIVAKGRVKSVVMKNGENFQLPNPDSTFSAERIGDKFFYGNGHGVGGEAKISHITIEGQPNIKIEDNVRSIEVQA
jgi:hypothetical protein